MIGLLAVVAPVAAIATVTAGECCWEGDFSWRPGIKF